MYVYCEAAAAVLQVDFNATVARGGIIITTVTRVALAAAGSIVLFALDWVNI